MKTSSKKLTLHSWLRIEIWSRNEEKSQGSKWKPRSSAWRGITTPRWGKESLKFGIPSLDKYFKTPRIQELEHSDIHRRDPTRSLMFYVWVHTDLQISLESRSDILGMRSISKCITSRLSLFVIYFFSCINQFVIQHLLMKVRQIWYQLFAIFCPQLFILKKKVCRVDYKLSV